nr:hypothetical protein [Neobacillus sp. Marseille-Q6967]
MYYYQYPYPPYPAPPVHQGYYGYPPLPRQYPPVDVKTFSQSIKTYRFLMDQGSILLDRLGDEDFDVKLMDAAQKGNKAEVDRLMKTLGLKVPVTTKYTPTGVTFELSSQPEPSAALSCCTLTIHMKWGK